jgi:hypothetical protein
MERLTITTDRLTLDGQGSAVLDGGGAGSLGLGDVLGVLTVDGARHVTISGFTVQNGQDGMVGQRGAVFAVRNTLAQDNVLSGMEVRPNTAVEVTDYTAQRNREGLVIQHNSSALFRGIMRTVHNRGTGVVIVGTSVGEFVGATLAANNNGNAGLAAGDSAHIETGGRLGGSPSQITASGNGQQGINLCNAVTLMTRDSDGTITVRKNPTGILVIGNAAVVNNPIPVAGFPVRIGTKFVIENNTTGVDLNLQSALFLIGGLTVRNNTTGVLADGADTVTVVSTPTNPSSITGNRTDVDLRFGTRATFNGVPIGSITCDDTVLSRGTTVCP